MRLRGRSHALVVTGRVARWHLTLMEIPSAGADPVSSVHKNSFRIVATISRAVGGRPDIPKPPSLLGIVARLSRPLAASPFLPVPGIRCRDRACSRPPFADHVRH